MKKFTFPLAWKSFKEAFKGFSTDKLTKLSASLAYYTVFSLGPLLIVIIFLSGLFLGHEAAQGRVVEHMQGLVGRDAAKQIQEIIKNASFTNKGGLAAVIGIVTLLIGASTVFGALQDSMNGIWGLKPKPKAGFIKLLQTRLLSFGVIGSLGFFLMVSLAVTAFVEGLNDKLKNIFPDFTVVLFYIIGLLLTLAVTTVLFAIIFKVLPDAKIKWKIVWPGAILTSVLFMLGKFAISFYITQSKIGTSYGAAGSLVILLVWVYYSSIILYFGAEFTKSLAFARGAKIEPDEYADWQNKPVVAGAHPADTRRSKEPVILPAMTKQNEQRSHPVKSGKDGNRKPPGMGTAIVGLLLYMIHSTSKGDK